MHPDRDNRAVCASGGCRDAFAALKLGGALGAEDPRAEPAAPPDVVARCGNAPHALVAQRAADVGLTHAASRETARIRRTRDHPFGVWTSSPTRKSSPRGEAPNAIFNHANATRAVKAIADCAFHQASDRNEKKCVVAAKIAS
ncbi:MAG: hypothetical protein ACXWKO_08400 [Phenylobacterium sp.]